MDSTSEGDNKNSLGPEVLEEKTSNDTAHSWHTSENVQTAGV